MELGLAVLIFELKKPAAVRTDDFSKRGIAVLVNLDFAELTLVHVNISFSSYGLKTSRPSQGWQGWRNRNYPKKNIIKIMHCTTASIFIGETMRAMATKTQDGIRAARATVLTVGGGRQIIADAGERPKITSNSEVSAYYYLINRKRLNGRSGKASVCYQAISSCVKRRADF